MLLCNSRLSRTISLLLHRLTPANLGGCYFYALPHVSGQSRKINPGQSRKINQTGFTLVELVVAIGILALIALGTGTVLNSVMKSNETSQTSLKTLQDAQRAMLILERDFLQMVARNPRVQGQENSIILKGGEFEFDSDESGVAFVRNGWHNPQMMLPRSSLQRVIYTLQEGVLIREHFTHVDTVIGAETRQRPLLNGITDFEVLAAFEFEREELDWKDNFEAVELPIALKVTVESDVLGKIERVFQVAP